MATQTPQQMSAYDMPLVEVQNLYNLKETLRETCYAAENPDRSLIEVVQLDWVYYGGVLRAREEGVSPPIPEGAKVRLKKEVGEDPDLTSKLKGGEEYEVQRMYYSHSAKAWKVKVVGVPALYRIDIFDLVAEEQTA